MINEEDDEEFQNPKTEKEKKEYYRRRVTRSLEQADKMKSADKMKKETRFPPPTPEQEEFMKNRDMYGNPLKE